jgi:hypothetical protein
MRLACGEKLTLCGFLCQSCSQASFAAQKKVVPNVVPESLFSGKNHHGKLIAKTRSEKLRKIIREKAAKEGKG